MGDATFRLHPAVVGGLSAAVEKPRFWRVGSSFLPLCHIVKGYVLIKLLKNTILATAFLAVSGAYAAPSWKCPPTAG
jgi:hypothetical protein